MLRHITSHWRIVAFTRLLRVRLIDFGLRKYAGAQDVAWPSGVYAPMAGCPPCVEVPAMRCPLGNEPTIDAFIWHLLLVVREIRRVLRDDGVAWVNLGDSYCGYKGENYLADKSASNLQSQTAVPESHSIGTPQTAGVSSGNLLAIPHRFALAAQADGWILRQSITWIKKSPMPESVKGWGFENGKLRRGSWRPTSATEQVFMFTKQMGYYADSTLARVGSNSLNSIHSIKELLPVGIRQKTRRGAAKCSIVSLNDQLAPMLVFGCFLAMKGVLVEKRNDDFSKIADFLNSPCGSRVKLAFFSDNIQNTSTDVFLSILQNLSIIASELDLNSKAELIVGVGRSLSSSIPQNKASLSVKQTSKIISEIVANFQSIRDAFAENPHFENIIHVDLIQTSIPFLDSFRPLAVQCGNFIIPETLVQKADFLLSEIAEQNVTTTSSISHNNSSPSWLLPGDINTEVSTQQGHNLWNWIAPSPSPYKDAHYATFPTNLIRPLILSSVPRRCCPECGQGWAAVVESRRMKRSELDKTDSRYRPNDYNGSYGEINGRADAGYTFSQTTGYRPTCQCGREDYKPGIVLDPFVGSGTTLEVARECGVKAIGLDISHEYLDEQASWRGLQIAKPKFEDMPLFAEVSA